MGKSTLIDTLYDTMHSQNLPVFKTREPGGCKLSEALRDIVLQKKQTIPVSLRAELLLFLTARAQKVEEVLLPKLAEGQIILCDRFNDSTLAYQGAARSFDLSVIEAFCNFASHNLTPDITFFLDLDPVIGLSRVKHQTLDRIEVEGVSFHQTVRKAYQRIAEKNPKRVVTIDASKSIEDVYSEVYDHIQKKLSVCSS